MQTQYPGKECPASGRHRLAARRLLRRAGGAIAREVELRRQGESQRTIAEKMGMSQKQVRRDLKEATESGVSVEPESGRITGKDGKLPRHGSANRQSRPVATGRTLSMPQTSVATRLDSSASGHPAQLL